MEGLEQVSDLFTDLFIWQEKQIENRMEIDYKNVMKWGVDF